MKILKTLFLTTLILSSNIAFAQAVGSTDPTNKDFQLVPCTGASDCDYNALIKGVNNLVKYFLILIIPIIIAMITYSGFLYFSATDNPGNKEKAIHMLRNVAIGIFWVFFAYLIVYSLLKWLIPEGSPFVQQSGQTNVEGVIQLNK